MEIFIQFVVVVVSFCFMDFPFPINKETSRLSYFATGQGETARTAQCCYILISPMRSASHLRTCPCFFCGMYYNYSFGIKNND